MTKNLIVLLLLAQIAYRQRTIRGITMVSADTVVTDTINRSPNAAFNSKIKLAAIDKSSAKVDIRLYKHHSLSNTKTVRRLFLIDTVWSAAEFDEGNKPRRIKRYKLTAKPHFDSIFILLLEANIMTLPNQSELKDKMRKDVRVEEDGTTTEKKIIMTDGEGYTIEIKIGDKFRIYQFDNPETYARFYDNVRELNDYVKIVQIFEKFLLRGNNR